MTTFWRSWLNGWCLAVALFGLVLILGAFAATAAPVEALLVTLRGGEPFVADAYHRFSLAVLGAVTLGWSVTLYAAISAALRLGAEGAPVWRLVTASVLVWFVIDSLLSVATGFALNVVPNLVLAAGYLLPVLASGVMGADAAAGRPARR